METGSRREIVFRDGLSWTSFLRFPDGQFTYSVESAVAQNFLSSSSFLNLGMKVVKGQGARLARHRLFQISAQILENLLFPLLDFEQDRLRHPSIVPPRMDLTRLQKDSPQIGDAFLREHHLVVALNHSSSSSIPRFRKSLEV